MAEYHFEETPGSTTFYDSSGEENNATCTNCPTVTGGLFGQGVDFDGADDYVVIPSVINPISDTFTAAAWFNVTDHPTTRIILQQQDGTGTGRNWLYLRDSGNIASFLGGSRLTGSPVSTGEWHHAAVTYDGTTLSLYLDGNPENSDDRAMEASDGVMLLGIHKSLSEDFFIGSIDEVAIFDRALSAAEIYALAQSQVAGVASVELSLESFDFGTETATPNWQPATLDQPGTRLSTWSYTVPGNLEDFYQISIRGEDAFGNTSSTGTVWRGTIDTLDPRISFSIQHRGGGSAAQTEYTFTVDDLFLDDTSLVQPCTENELVPGYDDDTGVLSEISATCKVEGHQTDPVSVTACDAADHCTTETVTPPIPVEVDGVAILTPTNQNTVTGLMPVTVTGGAFAAAGIRDVTVSVDDSVIEVIPFNGTITDTPWEVIWTPTTLGAKTLKAVMTDSGSATFTDTITVDVVHTITVNSLNDPGDGTCDDTECTLREAIAAAVVGDVIGFNVTGTITLTGGELTINQDLTIGGLAAADLTIDGNNAGRVFNIASGNVTISNVTIANGNDSNGGGIFNAGTLTLTSSTVSGSSAISEGGGIFNDTSGTLTLTNSTVSSSSATAGGGIFSAGPLTLDNSIVSGNSATIVGGGILNANSTLTLNNTTISGNSAASLGGGGIFNAGTVTLTSSTVSGNEATKEGGGIFSTVGTVTLDNSTVSSNEAGSDGGGIYTAATNLSLSDSNITGNSAVSGGGIYNTGFVGTLILTNSTVSSNEAGGNGGGVFNSGGVTLTLNQSTINDNSSGTLPVESSTLSNGEANGTGGGIWNSGTAEVNIKNTIVANNLSGGDCSGGVTSLGHNLNSDNSCGLDGTGDLTNIDPKLHHLQHNGGSTFTHALLPGSPAIDAIPAEHCVDHESNPVTTDQRGVARKQGVACDIGSYESGLGVMTGIIYLEGRTDHSGVMIEGDGFTTVSHADGTFIKDLLVGIHGTVTASMPGYLSAQAVDVETGNSATVILSEVILPAGDANGDSNINSADLRLVTIGLAQETQSGITVDMNGDGQRDVLDLALVGINFGKVGPINWAEAD